MKRASFTVGVSHHNSLIIALMMVAGINNSRIETHSNHEGHIQIIRNSLQQLFLSTINRRDNHSKNRKEITSLIRAWLLTPPTDGAANRVFCT